ncbi:MAG: cobalt-precorrin 5A hydrolase [Ruminococcus sp.]|nr:cobalt-precorrin 5A hydrolase [Ruminococcus sp.]
MNIALISLTEKGRVLSERLAELSHGHTVRRYCFHSHTDENAVPFTDLSALTADLFSACDALVFVCACGIAVRVIAPHIRSKTEDPAVIVIPDSGSHVIPILSGHIGGANALSRRIAALIGSEAVITTSTDTGGLFSPDSFAKANGLTITDMSAAKRIAALITDGKKVGLCCEYPHGELPEGLIRDKDCTHGIYIGKNIKSTPFDDILRLIPRDVVLGIGCRKNTPFDAIENAVLHVLASADIPVERLYAAASADLKKNEEGLLQFCEKYSLPLYTYTAEELMSADGEFTASEFVRSVTGADNVCERSAVLCSGGKLIVRKQALNGVTVAAAERPVSIDFERSIL